MHNSKHIFAFFVPSLSEMSDDCVVSGELAHRMIHVLRVVPGQVCIFFDYEVSREYVVRTVAKVVHGQLSPAVVHPTYYPRISCAVPILKRDAFEQVVYAAQEFGVYELIPLITHKSQRMLSLERLHRVCVSAAEQSKQFRMLTIRSAIPLTQFSALSYEKSLYFDVSGKSLAPVMHQLHTTIPASILCLIGPEGDLSLDEKKYVEQQGMLFCKLTPTVLKAEHAFLVGVGAVSSLMYVRE